MNAADLAALPTGTVVRFIHEDGNTPQVAFRTGPDSWRMTAYGYGRSVGDAQLLACGTRFEVMAPELQLDSLPVWKRDDIIGRVMQFLIARGYRIFTPFDVQGNTHQIL